MPMLAQVTFPKAPAVQRFCTQCRQDLIRLFHKSSPPFACKKAPEGGSVHHAFSGLSPPSAV